MSRPPLEGGEGDTEAAKGDALRWLTYRDRSADEVRKRLAGRGHPPDVAEQAVEWLERLGYVDDVRFAENWVESRTGAKPLGRLRLFRELIDKGIAEETAQAAIDRLLPEEKERGLALAVGTSRFERYRDVPLHVAKRRLGAFLMRRGFRANAVTDVLRAIDSGGRMPDDGTSAGDEFARYDEIGPDD